MTYDVASKYYQALPLEEFPVVHAFANGDDHAAAQEQVLHLVGISVGPNVDQVPVPAHLLETERALVHLKPALVLAPDRVCLPRHKVPINTRNKGP
jgi:hypothetical protein